MSTNLPPRLLQVREVADRLSLRLPQTYAIIQAGLLPAVRIGRQIRVDPRALEAFVKSGGRGLPPSGEQ